VDLLREELARLREQQAAAHKAMVDQHVREVRNPGVNQV
jgi:hypothetical protein